MSQFIEMFGTVKNNTHNFPIMTIGEFAYCFAGATPSTSHPEYWENGRIRWMSSGEVHKGHVEDTDSRITELGYKSASTRMVPIHSIVIAIAGQGKTRGTVAITEVDLCTNQSLCAIVPDERVNYSYLYHNLQGRYLELRGLSGDVNGRGGLNLKIIQKIPVILPPIEKQQQFASIAQQADKSKFGDFKSQFIEMFDFNDLSLTSPANDFSKYCKDDTSSATKIVAGDYLSKGIYPIYDQSKDNTIAGYTNKKEGLCDNVPAVLFGDHSRVIKYINTPFFIGADGVKIIRPKINEIIPEFLYYDLKYHTIPNTGYNRHFKFVKMLKLTKASMEKQNEFLLIARQADKSKSVIQKALVYLNDIQSDELKEIA